MQYWEFNDKKVTGGKLIEVGNLKWDPKQFPTLPIETRVSNNIYWVVEENIEDETYYKKVPDGVEIDKIKGIKTKKYRREPRYTLEQIKDMFLKRSAEDALAALAETDKKLVLSLDKSLKNKYKDLTKEEKDFRAAVWDMLELIENLILDAYYAGDYDILIKIKWSFPQQGV